MADHAQVVLVSTLHVVLAFLPHGPGQPLPVRTLSLGRHGRNADFSMCAGVGLLAFSVAIVGLFTLPASDQVVAVLAAVEALEDVDPQGFLALFVLAFLRWVVGDGWGRRVEFGTSSHGGRSIGIGGGGGGGGGEICAFGHVRRGWTAATVS